MRSSERSWGAVILYAVFKNNRPLAIVVCIPFFLLYAYFINIIGDLFYFALRGTAWLFRAFDRIGKGRAKGGIDLMLGAIGCLGEIYQV